MKWLGIAALGLVVLVLVIVVIGALLPEQHVARSRVIIRAPVAQVWAALTNVAEFPTWRSDVTSVEIISTASDTSMWREHGSNGDITFERLESVVPSRLVTRIADDDLPFGGTWTYELAEADGGTALTITEDGVVRNPVFRFMSRFVFGHHATQEAFARALGRKFGHDAEPERLQ